MSEEKTSRVCNCCRNPFQGFHWQKQCYTCYKEYRILKEKPIMKMGYKSGVYITHPNATKEEVDEWIKTNKQEIGWGAQEWKPENFSKFKIWINSENYD